MATNNPIFPDVTVTIYDAPLADSPTRGDFEVAAHPDNVGNVQFLSHDGVNYVEWVPGEYHYLRNVDLADITVKGTDGDIVRIVGITEG